MNPKGNIFSCAMERGGGQNPHRGLLGFPIFVEGFGGVFKDPVGLYKKKLRSKDSRGVRQRKVQKDTESLQSL